MSLKSSVNASIIKSDLRRYWYMSALFALMIFLTSVMFVISGPYYKDATDAVSFVQSEFARTMSLSLISVCIFCVLIPAVVFSYMHHKSAVSLMHSLPSKRGGLFLSHLISCAILITVAFLINAAILLSMKGSVDFYYRVSDVFMWLFVSLVYCFVISGISIICAMITGSFISSVIAPYVLASIIPLCEMIFYYVCEVYLYGFDTNNPFVISPKIYMDYSAILKNGGIILYLVLGIVCLVGALICYKKRHLENHGMVVSFKKLNPVFLYGVAIAAGFCGFMYIGEVTDIESLWFALPFGVIGVIVARMIIQKTFKPNGFIKPIAIYAVFICIIYAFSGLDITGYENRIPDIEEIESVNVVGSYGQLGSTYIDGVEVLADNDKVHNPTVVGEDIQTVVALHKAIIENKKDLDKKIMTNTNYTYQPIEYTLKNGKTLKRSYRLISGDELVYEQYGSVMEIPSVKANRFTILSDATKHFDGAQINIYDRNMKYVSNDDLTKLIEVMKQDISEAKYEDYDYKDSAITIRLEYKLPTKTKDGEEITDTNLWWERQETYNIHKSYKNTIKLLSEWGINNGMDILDDIKSVSINKEVDNVDEMMNYMVSEKDTLTTVTDKEKIIEIIRYMDENAENSKISDNAKRYEFVIEFTDQTTSFTYIVSDKQPPGI